MTGSTLVFLSPSQAQQTLGRELARLRLARNWSQSALAARAGVSLPTVSRLERGAVVGIDVFLKIASALDALAPLVRAVQTLGAGASQAQSLDELEKQLTPRRRGRSTP